MRISALLSLPLALCLSAPAFAAVMVLPVEGTNLEQGEIDAIGQMVASAYQMERKETVVPPGEVKKALDESGGYPQAAQKLGATEYIYVTAVRLNQRIVITAARYSPDGKLLHSAKISATSLDDVEPASERLAKALINEQTTTQARTIDTVTTTEQRQPTRAASQKVAGFKGSFTYPIGWSETIATQMSGAFDLRLESRNHFIELGIGLTFAAADQQYSYGGLWSDIGASFYLTDSNTAPYVGFGVLPRLMSDSGDSFANLAVYGQVGVMFFRESTTRIYTDVRVAQNLLPVVFSGDVTYDATGFPTGADRKNLYPTELSFSIGMGF